MKPFAFTVYERGASGAPSISQAENIARVARAIEWTIADSFGFESASASWEGDIADALYWMDRLGCNAAIFGPDAERCWEGLLYEVSYSTGDEQHGRSLEGVANRVRVAYTTVNGVSLTTSPISNTDSQALYGVRDEVLSLSGATSTEASNFATQFLAARAWPSKRASSSVSARGSRRVSITLRFVGWYESLGWVVTSRTDTTTETTTVQLGALLGTSSPGIGATNAFLSTSTARITASGISASRVIEPNTTYRQKIEDLLAQGNSSGQRYAYGVYEGRTFVAETWAGATPAVVTYRRWVATDYLTTGQGGRVDAWNVRPNAIYEVADSRDSAGRSVEQDTASRYYVARVRVGVGPDGVGLSLEPGESDSIDALVRQLNRGRR